MERETMAEKLIDLDSIELAVAVFGNCDQNIRLLESELGVTAVCRGAQLKLTGESDAVTAAGRAIDGMLTLLENHAVIQRIDGKFNQGSCKFAILPTVLAAVSSEKLNAVVAVLKKEEENEETEENTSD